MPFRSMEQGIDAIRQGNKEEGALLLKFALRQPELQGSLRATAYLWLAETTADIGEKRAYYREALDADPNNEEIKKRLALIMSMDLPPMDTTQTNAPIVAPPSTPAVAADPPPPPPMDIQRGDTGNYAAQQAPTVNRRIDSFVRTVGVLGGPAGLGTGFFLTNEGLVATTRHVVGGMEKVTIELEAGFRVPGQVRRSYSEYDLAFIETGLSVRQLLPFAPDPVVPDSTPLTAISHTGRVMNGQRRPTVDNLSPDWFPTTIPHGPDSGGNPVFDNRNMMVGMLTRNANRHSNYFYALNMQTISRCLHSYLHEARDGMQRTYCPDCGYLSQAGVYGGFYCEICGSVLPDKVNEKRFPVSLPRVEALYGENMHRPCPTCGARVGYYEGHCLRCGESPAQRGGAGGYR